MSDDARTSALRAVAFLLPDAHVDGTGEDAHVAIRDSRTAPYGGREFLGVLAYPDHRTGSWTLQTPGASARSRTLTVDSAPGMVSSWILEALR